MELQEGRANRLNDLLGSPHTGNAGPDSSITSLVRHILASREVELRNAEMALDLELTCRKLELHRRYACSLNRAIEQALLVLCDAPRLSEDIPVSEPSDPSKVDAPSVPDAAVGTVAGEIDSESRVADEGRAADGTGNLEGSFPVSKERENYAAEASSRIITQAMSDAESRANALLVEASDVLSRAQDSARQILERALAQGSEIVSKAEEQSRYVDERATEVSAVTAPAGSTIYQKALEMARRQGVGAAPANVESDEVEAAPSGEAAGRLVEQIDVPSTNPRPAAPGRTETPDATVLPRVRIAAGDFGEEFPEEERPRRQNGYSVSTVRISPLKSFAPVVDLERAMRALEGVRQVRVLSFKGGLLELQIEHDSRVRLDEAMSSLNEYRFRLLDWSDGRLSLELAGGDEPLLSTQSTGRGTVAHAIDSAGDEEPTDRTAD